MFSKKLAIFFIIFMIFSIALNAKNISGYGLGWEKDERRTVIDSNLPLPKHYFEGNKKNEVDKSFKELMNKDSKSDNAENKDKDENKDSKSNKAKDKESKDSKKDAKDKKKEQEKYLRENAYSLSADSTESKIHELEKERYMLESQLELQEIKLIKQREARKRSGYYFGIGFGWADPVYSETTVTDLQGNVAKRFTLNSNPMIKVGYIKYHASNFGIKAELFDYMGITDSSFIQHLGFRISVLHEREIFNGGARIGLVLGAGVGVSLFRGNWSAFGFNYHLGISFSHGDHGRFEFERLFLAPFESLKNDSYMFSYSWIF